MLGLFSMQSLCSQVNTLTQRACWLYDMMKVVALVNCEHVNPAKERGYEYDNLLAFSLVHTICHPSGTSLEFGSIRLGHKPDYETFNLLKLV